MTQFLSMPVEVEPCRTVTNGTGVTLHLTVRADTLPTITWRFRGVAISAIKHRAHEKAASIGIQFKLMKRLISIGLSLVPSITARMQADTLSRLTS